MPQDRNFIVSSTARLRRLVATTVVGRGSAVYPQNGFSAKNCFMAMNERFITDDEGCGADSGIDPRTDCGRDCGRDLGTDNEPRWTVASDVSSAGCFSGLDSCRIPPFDGPETLAYATSSRSRAASMARAVSALRSATRTLPSCSRL